MDFYYYYYYYLVREVGATQESFAYFLPNKIKSKEKTGQKQNIYSPAESKTLIFQVSSGFVKAPNVTSKNTSQSISFQHHTKSWFDFLQIAAFCCNFWLSSTQTVAADLKPYFSTHAFMYV